jgi:peptidoglycan/LPS O-acetylase OafA/YrhL
LFFAAAGALAEQLGPIPRPESGLPLWIALTYNCATWLWSFTLIGVFLRYLPRQQALLTYLAQSSYWVYLVHMPLTIGFGALLYGLDWPVAAKMFVNITATTLVCLGSYQLFVRGTVLSVLLNGHRFSTSPSKPVAHASTP